MEPDDWHKRELLLAVQLAAGNRRILDEFLVDLLTPQEYEDMLTRWQIIKQLTSGVTQREIARSLNVSITKITRGSRELRDQQGGFWQVLRLLSKKKK